MRLLHLVTDAKWLGRVEVQSEAAPGSASSAPACQAKAQGLHACHVCLLSQEALQMLHPSSQSSSLHTNYHCMHVR